MKLPTRHDPDARESLGSADHLADDARADVDASLVRAILILALMLGVAADALFRDGPVGLGFPIWVALLGLATLPLVWRAGRQVPAEVSGWLLAAVLFSTGLAWRDSETLQFLDFVATVGALGMAAVGLSDARGTLFAERLRDTVWAAARVLRSVAAGVVPLALRHLSEPRARETWARGFRPALRATLIALALLLVFGSLLRSADPIFASLIALPAVDVGQIISHVIIIGLFAWVVGGWARGALLTDPSRRRAPETLPIGLGRLDITTALVTLNVLFAVFVVAQLGWFFGGEQFLRDRTGLTAAEYARQGFFQMVWVVVLVVPILVATRAALRPEGGRELERRHTALSLPIVALLGAIIVSTVMRLRLYVQYYGLTTDRFYPLVFMGWLALVLAWLALTVLRGAGRSFVAGTVVTGALTLAGLNLIAPDALVARVNIARAAQPSNRGERPLDLRHLSSLSGEAAELATAAVLAPIAALPRGALRDSTSIDRCWAAHTLLSRWGPQSRNRVKGERPAPWRSWNAGESSALRVVGAHAAQLRAIKRESCRNLPGAPR